MGRPYAVLAGLSIAMMFVVTGCSSSEQEFPPLPAMSQEEKEAVWQRNADSLWEQWVLMYYPNAVRPDTPARIRVVTLSEWGEAQVGCLQTKGFDVFGTGDGGVVHGNIPESQKEFLAIAEWECMMQYPTDPVYSLPYTEDEMRFIYRYYTGELTQCLADEGYTVSDPPSEAVFIAGFREGAPSWTPYGPELSTVRHSEWLRLNRECPQMPSGFRGF